MSSLPRLLQPDTGGGARAGLGIGGWGSGPARRYTGTVEEARRLDVLLFHRRRALRPGGSGTVSWSGEGAEVAAVGWTATVDGIHLVYQVGPTDTMLRYPVGIDRTQCFYGGEGRPWFRCPNRTCGRRCRFLYQVGQHFVCAGCARLTYGTRRASRNPSALASIHNVGIFQDGQGIRRLHYRLVRARNPRRVAALRRRIAWLEALALADLAALNRLVGRIGAWSQP